LLQKNKFKMRTTFLLAVLLFAVNLVSAQDNTRPNADEKIYTSEDVDTQADFPGGIDVFYSTFAKHFKAPQVPGLVDKVVLSFVIEKDGTPTDIRVVHDAGFGTGEQCRQILETLPKWAPAAKDSKKVRSQYLLPIAVITE